MGSGLDLLDLRILYDTARGAVGLRRREEILPYALLSLMGACGASCALLLERAEKNLFRIGAARGFPAEPAGSFRAGRSLREALGETGRFLAARGFGPQNSSVRRFAERWGVEVLLGACAGGELRWLFALGGKLCGDPYSTRDLTLASEIVKLASQALAPCAPSRRAPSAARAGAHSRVEALRKEYRPLRAFRGDGARTAALFEELVALADFDLPVLILGETGTGKEIVARAIHELSRQRRGSFEAINCAAIPRDLMASALFGHERGAFTGAVSSVRGAFERAGEGTIFLDEIGDMPPETQASLLRVLQERTFCRVGGETVLPAKARVLSATNRDLLAEVEHGRFRSDLYYRLQMYTVRIAPLRERREEIPALVKHILEARAGGEGRPPRRVSPDFLRALAHRELPGNVRELESLLVAALVRAGDEEELRAEHLPQAPELRWGEPPDPAAPVTGELRRIPHLRAALAAKESSVPSYEAMERSYIRSVLQLTEGNKKQAAQLMGIPRTTLHARIRKLGLG